MVNLLLAIIYLSFISLGLPDALLGASWPTMYQQFEVPMSYAGIISVTISVGTIASSLLSDRLTLRFGTGKVTAMSVAMTAAALLGFSLTGSFWGLLIWAVPYGLGAGGVDASLNNYVALHYESRHMSWLHCMWGVGASIGPYIMGFALAGGHQWNMGYRYVALIQAALTAVLVLSLPIWKKRPTAAENSNGGPGKALNLKEIMRIPGAKEVLIAFFCYCALEQTAGLWASTYLVRHMGLTEETAARLASLFYIGITAGRFVSGFLTFKLNDTNMIRLGEGIIVAAIAVMVLPLGNTAAMAGLVLVGIGCAPIYPCVIHSTPVHFGEENSQAIIGVQMASAYGGSLLMPPIFGWLANHISIALYPVFLAVIAVAMLLMTEQLNKKCPLE